jgi:hypothetical protein
MATMNRAAFSRDDVEDAKRGHPDFDLRDYAAWRGLEFLDHRTPAGYRAAVPGKEELQSNVLRGVLPGGEYGVIAHEGLEIRYSGDSLDWNGTFYSLRVTAKGRAGIPWWVPLPWWGELLAFFSGSTPTAMVRVPCTVAAVRVSETAASLTHLRFDRRRSSPPFSFGKRTKLGELVGHKGWDMYAGPKQPEPEMVERLVAEPVAELLRAHTDDGLFQAVVWCGTLVVRRNGYLRSPEELDELARAVSLLAGRLREVCLPLAEPQWFDASLPLPPFRTGVPGPPGFLVDGTWCKWALETAERHALEIEDPFAYHRAFPSVPVPGIAHIVLRGTIPGLGLPGRLVLHRERGALRPAVLMAAPPGARPTPPGGVQFTEHAARLEITDDLLAIWSTNSWSGGSANFDIDAFCAHAAAVLGASRFPAVHASACPPYRRAEIG